MNDFTVAFEGAPKLGYVSHDQLTEFAVKEKSGKTSSSSKKIATTLWYRLHWLNYSTDHETGIQYYSDDSVNNAEFGIETKDPELGNVVNLDTVEHLLEARVVQSIDMLGKKAVALAQGYIEQRKGVLG